MRRFALVVGLFTLVVGLACSSSTPTVPTVTPTLFKITDVPAPDPTALMQITGSPPVVTPAPTSVSGGQLVRSDGWIYRSNDYYQIIWLYDRDFDTHCTLFVSSDNQSVITRLTTADHLLVWSNHDFDRIFLLSSDVRQINLSVNVEPSTISISLRCMNINFESVTPQGGN